MELAAALVLAAAGTLLVWSRLDRHRSDARSVERYRDVLERLQHVEHAGPVGSLPAPAPAVPVAPAPAVPVAPAPAVRGAHPPVPAPVPAKARVAALAARSPSRRVTVVAVAVVVVAGAAVSAGVLAHGSSPRAGLSYGAGPSRSAAGRSLTKKSATPAGPATLPPPRVVSETSGTGAAVYAVSAGPVEVALSASARCWVQVRAGNDLGPVIFEGILQAGDRRSFQEASGLWVRVGYPAGISVTVEGDPVPIPAGGSPFDLSVVLAS